MEQYILQYGLETLLIISIFGALIICLRNVKLKDEVKFLNHELMEKKEEISIAHIKLIQKEEILDSLRDEQVFLVQKNEQLIEDKFNLQKQLEINQLKYSTMQTQLSEWEKLKEESITNARAAIFAVGNQLGNKLIEDHKRETEQAKQENEKIVKETTNQLYSQFQNIINSVSIVTEQVQNSNASFEKIKRALLSPIGAGSLAEITLENILKASGLITGKDYITQFTVSNEGLKLRPDVVIFLPSNNIMIIDSKASQHFFGLEEELTPEIVNGKIKLAMRTHLKDLINKAYFKAVKEHIEKHHNFKVNYISMVMFLPSEAALEKIQSIDNKFIIDAWEGNIYPAGPVGLVNILAHTKFMISENDKAENHRHIIAQVEKLLVSIGKIYEYSGKVGANLHTAIKNFDRLAASFNGSLTPKIRNLEKLGLSNSNQLKFKKLDRMQLIQSEELNLLDVEESNILIEEES